MHIGLIGGIGVTATLSYYDKLTAEMARRDAPLSLTIVHADVKTLIQNTLSDARSAQAEIYADLIGRLKRAGCDVAAITSLGGHFCFAEAEAMSPLPLISGVAPLDAYFAAQGLKTVGLLGTSVVMRSALYGQLAQTEARAPRDPDAIGAAYMAMAAARQCSAEQRALFFAAGQQMMEDGAEAVVLAGTDLSLAFDGEDPSFPVVDALDVHVAKLVELAIA